MYSFIQTSLATLELQRSILTNIVSNPILNQIFDNIKTAQSIDSGTFGLIY